MPNDSRINIATAPQEAAVVRRGVLHLSTPGRSFIDVTPRVRSWAGDIGARDGMLTVFLQHTSASLTIQENADPDVQADLLTALDRLAPEKAGYRHDTEGPDDMPAHIRTMLTGNSLVLPVADGKLLLGTWQALYLVEHRRAPHERTASLMFVGTVRG
jgi:secondary thiamine-phosphate synthase enzyme